LPNLTLRALHLRPLRSDICILSNGEMHFLQTCWGWEASASTPASIWLCRLFSPSRRKLRIWDIAVYNRVAVNRRAIVEWRAELLFVVLISHFFIFLHRGLDTVDFLCTRRVYEEFTKSLLQRTRYWQIYLGSSRNFRIDPCIHRNKCPSILQLCQGLGYALRHDIS
jgi:hypothetical protein